MVLPRIFNEKMSFRNRKFLENVTREIFRKHFKVCSEEWRILKQNLHCMVRNGGSNMTRCCYLSEIQPIWWWKKLLKKLMLVPHYLTKYRKIAGGFNHSIITNSTQSQCLKRFTRLINTLELTKRLDSIKDSLSLYQLYTNRQVHFFLNIKFCYTRPSSGAHVVVSF